MLPAAPSDPRASTGLAALDDVLGGLYRGDNVVWLRDRAPVEPFYRAAAGLGAAFELRTAVSFGAAVNTYGVPGLAIVHAERSRPADVLRELHRLCRRPARRLVLFESLDSMVRSWGLSRAREFFSRTCPLLLEAGAVTYWTASVRGSSVPLQDAVGAVAQCVLHVDERHIRVVKAEGRGAAARGAVLHWHVEGGRPVLSPPELTGRVATSLRAVRRERTLSQHELADLAGVSASAISQVERAERGLSLATLVRLGGALGMPLDELVRGEDRSAYRIGRRTNRDGTLVDADPHVRLVQLDAGAAGAPAPAPAGTGTVAVAHGLVQVSVAGQLPTLRHGEVLVAASAEVTGWRNLGQSEALLFWIVA